MRLDYFISHCTGLSRKQAKQLIRDGAVQVNGQSSVKANSSVDGVEVLLHGKPLQLPGHRYLMMHKPDGVVCSTDDPLHRTVLDLLPAELRRGLHVVGRLDRDTTGLVLLTSDGEWSHRLASPKYDCAKRYLVSCVEPVSDADLVALSDGILLRNDDKPTLPAMAERLTSHTLLLTLSEGRYHQVKRMLAARGNRVDALHRQQIGQIVLDPLLQPGDYRHLSAREIAGS